MSPPRRDGLGWLAHGTYLTVAGLLVFAFAWSLVPAVQQQNESPCRPLAPEDRDLDMPSATLRELSGEEIRLEDFAGKFLIVNFWATWCEPCITEWPELDLLAHRLSRRDDIEVIAISVEKDQSQIAPFLARMTLQDTPVRVLWDPTEKLHTRFGSSKLPDTYFVDPEGRISHAFINVRDWGSPGAARCVESVAPP